MAAHNMNKTTVVLCWRWLQYIRPFFKKYMIVKWAEKHFTRKLPIWKYLKKVKHELERSIVFSLTFFSSKKLRMRSRKGQNGEFIQIRIHTDFLWMLSALLILSNPFQYASVSFFIKLSSRMPGIICKIFFSPFPWTAMNWFSHSIVEKGGWKFEIPFKNAHCHNKWIQNEVSIVLALFLCAWKVIQFSEKTIRLRWWANR